MLAAGGVVLRHGAEGCEAVIIHRPRHADWSFPKGKVDLGETLAETALREVWEETALRCALGVDLGDVEYELPEGGLKRTRYWTMRVVIEEEFVPGDEVDGVRWVPVAALAGELTSPIDRALAVRLTAELAEPTKPRCSSSVRSDAR